jgi:uncharacterized membrane protein YdjX (TVP38/TMEM64 family)
MNMLRRLAAQILEHRRAVFGGILVLASAITLGFFFTQIRDFYQQLFLFRETNSLGLYLSFAALLILACLTSIFPASIIGLLAGMVFGMGKGFALSAGSIMIGALLAFVFSRYFFRTVSRRLVAKVIDLDKLEANLARNGWRYALVLRLTPLAPFSITSYALALTPIALGQYLLSTLASLPFLLVCVYLGGIGGVVVNAEGNLDGEVLRQLAIMFSVASVFIAIFMYWLPRLARRLLTPDKE